MNSPSSSNELNGQIPLSSQPRELLSRQESSLSKLWSETSDKDDQPGHCTQAFAKIVVDHAAFRIFMTVVIAINVVELGLSCDFQGPLLDPIWFAAEHAFTAIFVAEMVTKIFAWRRAYFAEKANIIDFIIACSGMLDMWFLRFALSIDTISKLSLLRVLRLMRIARVAKLLSVQSHLQVMAAGMVASVMSMFWVGIMLTAIVYACGIACVEAFGRSDYGDEYLPYFANDMQFGNVPRAMLSLFNIVLLDEWTNIIRPVYDQDPWAVPFLIVFVVMTACGILNIMVGAIVDKVSEARQQASESCLEEHRRKQMEAVDNLSKIMFELDSDGNNRLSLQEVDEGRQHKEFRDVLEMMKLPKGYTINDLYTLLNRKDDEEIEGKVFTESMFRLIFSDNFQHMCMLHQSLNEIKHVLRSFHETTRSYIDESLEKVLHCIPSSHSILQEQAQLSAGSLSAANNGTHLSGTAGSAGESHNHEEESRFQVTKRISREIREADLDAFHGVSADLGKLHASLNQRPDGSQPDASDAQPLGAVGNVDDGMVQRLDRPIVASKASLRSPLHVDVPMSPPPRSAAPHPTPRLAPRPSRAQDFVVTRDIERSLIKGISNGVVSSGETHRE